MSHFSNHIVNIPGWRTDRKIVVIESDDWGSVRMPSKDAYNQFLNKGIRVDNDPYCRYDSIATEVDLTSLFETLSSVKDKNGHSAILTANTIMTNPDFEKIKRSYFREYYYESFVKTLERSSSTSNILDVWKQGMDKGIFKPQFHGREHLNIKKWLDALRNNETSTLLAFDFQTFGLTTEVSPSIVTNYMGAYDSCLLEDIDFYKSTIAEGLGLFEEIFGYRSVSFIPTTYTWSPKIEVAMKENGIKYIQGLVTQRIPVDDGRNFKFRKGNFQGTRNKLGMYYLMRNCFFEPTLEGNQLNVVDDCLRRINIAFQWKKAAVICSHRLNFIGAIDESNRTRNIKLFRDLLKQIVRYWPDVEFMSSDQLGELMRKKDRAV